MAGAFDREGFLWALDRLGRAAASNGVILEIALYGGAALMLASSFRFATEDADIAELGRPWPDWLTKEVAEIARIRRWSPEWLNEAVQFHLSALADRTTDHHEFGTFPRDGDSGLRVLIPSLDYMLALKLKAIRVNDPVKGSQEIADIQALLLAARVETIDQAIDILARYFPRSAREADKQRFYLKHIWPTGKENDDPPRYPVRGG